jgi:TRAP transporter TAXI family solute receptor
MNEECVKMNKKSMVNVLCALLTISLLLTGCSGSGSSNPPAANQDSTSSAPASSAPIYMRMGTGGTGGVFYTFGVGIGTLVSSKTNMQFTVESTKASVENMRLLDSKDIEVGFASFPTSLKSYKGNAPFDKNIEVNVLLQPYTNPVHLIVMADSPYQKLEDLKGKKISIGQPGSGNAEVATTFLEGLYGWVDGKDYSGQYLTYTESVEAFKNGQIDAAIFDTGFPTASVIDLSSWKPIRLLSVDASLIEKATNEYGKQFITTTIPGGTYRGQDKDTLTIGHGNYIMCRADWDEEYAYTFVKTIFENMDFVKNIHAVAKDLTPELAANGGGVPLHPGAIRYYKEVGAIK